MSRGRRQEFTSPGRELAVYHQLCPFTPKSWEDPGGQSQERPRELSEKEADSKPLLNNSAGNWILFTSANNQNVFLSIGASRRLSVSGRLFLDMQVQECKEQSCVSDQKPPGGTAGHLSPVTASEWVPEPGSLPVTARGSSVSSSLFREEVRTGTSRDTWPVTHPCRATSVLWRTLVVFSR